ncbi:MAG: CopG family ribbon-helix-helix protein [Alphaproteobacteria bacterium]
MAKNTERSRSSVIVEAAENYVAHSDGFIEQVKIDIADADAGRFATPEEVEATFEKLTQVD